MSRETDARRLYDTPGVGPAYRDARALPADTERLWTDVIRRAVAGTPVRLAVDVGAGTGRFTARLVDALEARVIGIERGASMIDAREPGALRSVTWVRGDAAALPIRTGVADLVMLSMVYHHFGDAAGVVRRELRRVLRAGGLVLLRTPTPETLREFEWMRFFPESLALDLARMPTSARAIDDFRASGFSCRDHSIIRQRIAANLAEYVARIRSRSFSSLQAMPDDVWAQRFAAFEAHCRAMIDRPIDEPVNLFVFEAS